MTVICVLLTLALSANIWFFASTVKALKKFERLDEFTKNKILIIECYMVFMRYFSTEELIKISKLPEDEIECFNEIHNISERIKTARNRIT